MNNFEAGIVHATRIAQRNYETMTGWWLSHGPESWIEHEVATSLSKMGFPVFPEASPKKVRMEQGKRPRGRPANNFGQRFDLVVWLKTKDQIKAIIEIKRAWNVADLRGDVNKVTTALCQGLARAGYLLAYTEAKGRRRSCSEEEKVRCRGDTLVTRLENWAETLGGGVKSPFDLC